MATALPNFFVVGAPRSGTTSLYRYLDQHPDIYMSPIKEPCFFAPEVLDLDQEARAAFERDAPAVRAYLDGPMREKRQDGLVLEWTRYLRLFEGVRGETAIGEASMFYLGSAEAARNIHARIPGARILAMLRDPSERLFSHYVSARVAGTTRRPFVDWLDTQHAIESARQPPFGPIAAGHYAEQLRRYLPLFPPAQIRIHLYDDYARAPRPILSDIFTFLGVDPDRPIDVSERHHVTLESRWPAMHRLLAPARRVIHALAPDRVTGWLRDRTRVVPPDAMTAGERRRAIEIYAHDIRALQELLQRDLGGWLAG